jgi:hypothetical protein
MLSLQTKMEVKNLIEQLDMEKCLKNSFKNYHTEGLWYINLFRDLDYTVKLYFMMPGLIANRNNGYLVSPHNHAYNFTTEVLFGSVRHIIMSEQVPQEDNSQWYKYSYHSSRKPNDRLEFVGRTNLGIESDINYTQGQAYYVDTNMLHSLIVPEHELTCLLLHQYEDKILDGTDFFSVEPVAPSFKNTYMEYKPSEINMLLDVLKMNIGL